MTYDNIFHPNDHSLSAEGGDDECHGGGAEEGEVSVDDCPVEGVVARQHGVEAESGLGLGLLLNLG